jgi:hypothetical protein
LQNGLKSYLGKNPHARQQKLLENEANSEQIAKIESELDYLDSLKREVRLQIRKGSNLQILDPSAISSRAVELQEKLGFKKREFQLLENELVITSPFVPFKKQASPRLIISVVSGTVLGLVLGLIAAVVLSFKRKD